MDGGARLGSCGIWNFLWRLGIHPVTCTVDALPEPAGSVVWAALDEGANPGPLRGLKAWVAAGGHLVASGDPQAWADILGWPAGSWQTVRPENPYAGLAWTVADRPAELIAPNRWPLGGSVTCPEDAAFVGTVQAVQGERQTPSRALLVPLDAPALVVGPRYCYLNGHPFAAFQAWLQGQVDLQPWLAWRHRLFWLDEWVSTVADMLFTVGGVPADGPRPGIPGLASTTVVLRHDVDHSRDVSYLEEENRRGLAATYAILRDGNTQFWRETLARHTAHESAFHYNTGRRDWLRDGVSRLRGRDAAPLVVSRAELTGRGLAKQVQWARDNGLGVTSLMRHLSFQPYPEWVDALDHVFAAHTDVAGGSSMFRGQVLRWGADRVDGATATVGEWPDPQSPSWLPFKLAHAADGGRLLRGWESTSVMESEPELVDQLLSHRLPALPQRVLTLGYHPAHAAGTTFHRSGSRPSFARVLDVLQSHAVDVRTSREVFRLADAAVSRRVA